ncbi:MAG TPA: MBOAT family O-acyltransferase [Planctomycetota bacterium]|nr:MBOAT family O-acyltransferase [Planctomycetota bacterium]
MVFNSLEFLIFFPLVATTFFLLPHRHRALFLLLASYFFYCWAVPVYGVLLLAITVLDWYCALRIEKSGSILTRRALLLLSLASNFGILFTFKYFNFFKSWLRDVAELFQTTLPLPTLSLLLPIGISFYVFQSVSYMIDVYNRREKAEPCFIKLALFISFFPQLVAGPIERSENLKPQFDEEKHFDELRVTAGLRLMLWGLFKKMVIADNIARIVINVYGDPESYSGPSLVTATVFFAFQIYCDFSGYCDVAIGAAQVLGYRLMDNFRRPYYSQSIGEFWKRWHISLSTWFRDYLYIPLGGNRVGRSRWFLNLLIVFLASGLWHGANVTFIIWGFLHGLYLIAEIIFAPARQQISERIGLPRFPALQSGLNIAFTFSLVCFGWIFFRAQNINQALYIASHLFSGWGEIDSALAFEKLVMVGSPVDFVVGCASIAFMEWVEGSQQHKGMRFMFSERPAAVRWAMYYALVLCILLLGEWQSKEFIYFRF